jgi:DNA-binding GntR family transcriptional regulator
VVNEKIYSEIKKRIVFLCYPPKYGLNIKELAREFGVSSMPIREIMILLENEELVHAIPNKGIYVNDINFQELKNIFEIRIFLIGLSGRLAAQRITPIELDSLKQLLNKMKKEKDGKKAIRLDAEFHDLLNCSTKNRTLVKVLERLRNRINRLWFFVKVRDDKSFSQTSRDFEELIKALTKRDSAKCEQILKNHILNFMEQIKENLYDEIG